MNFTHHPPVPSTDFTRREFLKTAALGAAALSAGAALPPAFAARTEKRPNFLFFITDQQGLDAISACGCPDVHTPNMDRLVQRGTRFVQSHSPNPLCSPCRSSLFTGRMPSETGVVNNGRPIRAGLPNLGEWLSQDGYDCFYAGKWHVPQANPTKIAGFNVLPTGMGGNGHLGDACTSRNCEGYLRNRTGNKPFLLVCSLLQPHDICEWITMHWDAPDELPYPEIASRLPALPANFEWDRNEPKLVRQHGRPTWSDRQWRYYLWSYYRHVEMVDAELGRVLNALEDTGQAENTVIVFTSDHGEGRGCHHMTTKNYLYEEALKVPLVVSWPGHIGEGVTNATHLVSGYDLMPTFSDYAGLKPPARMVGRSLRPLLEGKAVEGREFVAAQVQVTGRMIRTPDFKYITYQGDPVEQFFDMKHDPGETKNLAGNPKVAGVLDDHRKLLKEWEGRLDPAPA